MRKLTCFLLLTILPASTNFARADESSAPPPPAPPPSAEAAKPSVSPAHPVTLYVQDWSHLAEVTRTDARLFGQADWLSFRHTASGQIATTGLLVGGTTAVAATISRLSADHWTGLTKWSLTGGVSLVAVSLLTAWLVAPDHSDLVSVVNEWNERHPERLLAP